MNAYELGCLAALEKLGAGFPAKLLNKLRADGADMSSILRNASPEEVEALFQYVRPRPGGTPADIWISDPSFAKKLHSAVGKARQPTAAGVNAAGPRAAGGPASYGSSPSGQEARRNVSYAQRKMRGGGASTLERGLAHGLTGSLLVGNPLAAWAGYGKADIPDNKNPMLAGALMGIPGAAGGAVAGGLAGSRLSKLTHNPRYTVPGALIGAIAGNLGGGYLGGRLTRD
jgi:hypothetical protein